MILTLKKCENLITFIKIILIKFMILKKILACNKKVRQFLKIWFSYFYVKNG